jgi:hypothetical protein
MWFMNNVANPMVRFILRSPFHKMMSASLLLISYRGRKSGKTFTLPVNYAQAGRTIYIVPAMHEQKTWWRNLRGGAPVTLTLGGKAVGGQALVWEDVPDAMAAALEHYARRYPPAAKMYGIRAGADGTYKREDLLKAARSVVVVKVDVDG